MRGMVTGVTRQVLALGQSCWVLHFFCVFRFPFCNRTQKNPLSCLSVGFLRISLPTQGLLQSMLTTWPHGARFKDLPLHTTQHRNTRRSENTSGTPQGRKGIPLLASSMAPRFPGQCRNALMCLRSGRTAGIILVQKGFVFTRVGHLIAHS